MAQAQTTLHWDINGSTTGAGGATPSGTWNTTTANWTTNTGGTAATTTWSNPATANNASFSAGTDATGSYTVTLGTGINITNLTVQEGTPTFTGNTLTLAGASGSVFDITGTTTINSTLAGSAALSKSTGTGTLILGGANTYTSATTVNAGTLIAAHNTALGTTAGATTVSSGATLGLQSGITIGAEALSLSGSGFGSSGALRNLSGHNSYAGAITIASSAEIQSDTDSLTLSGAVNVGGQALTFDGAGSTNVTGALSFTHGGTLTKNGTGTTTISGTTTFAISGVSVSAGLLQFNSNYTNSNNNISNTTVASGATLALGGVTYGQPLFLNGSGVAGQAALWGASGTSTVSGLNITLQSDTAIGAAAGATLILAPTNSFAGGNSDLTIQGQAGGIVRLTSNAGFADLKIQSGTFQLGAAGRIPDTSSVILANTAGATLDLNNFNETVASISGGGVSGGNIALGTATLTTGGVNTTTSYGGVISGTGHLTKTGTGTLTLTNQNTYTGTTTVTAGALSLGAANTLADTSTLALNGGTLLVNGFADTIGTFSLTANSALNYQSLSGGLLTFGNVTAPGTNTLNVTNWIGNGGTASAASTTTGFFVTGGAITANMTALATDTTFAGWGTGTGWKTVAGGFELVPTLTGVTRWDNGAGTNLWSPGATAGTGASINWGGDVTPANAAGAGIYFGDEAPDVAQTPTLTSNTSAGTVIINGTGNHSYALTGDGTARTLTLDATGTGTAYLTVSGTEANSIGADAAKVLNLTLADNTLIQNNSTAATGLTIGSTASTLALGGNQLETTGASETIIHSVISGSGGKLLQSGTGTLELTAANTYTGGTTLSGGTLQIGNNAALGTGTLTVIGDTGARIEALGSARTLSNALDFNNVTGNIIHLTGSNNLTLSSTTSTALGAGDAQFKVDAGLTLTIAATLTSGPTASDTVTKSGTGTLLLTGNNNSGWTQTAATAGIISTFVNEGTLKTTGLFGGHNMQIASGATFQADTAGGSLLNNSTIIVGGTGTFLKTGANTYSANHTFAMGSGGLIDIQGGTYTGPSNSITWTNNLADLNVAAGAAFGINNSGGNPVIVDAITGGGTITQAGALTFGVDNGTATFTGILAGAGKYTKAGTGTQTLAGASTNTGGIDINGGSLSVTNTTGSGTGTGTVAVNAGGTLAGTGTITGTTTFANNARLAPGTPGTVGTLTLGTTTLNNTSQLDYQLASTANASDKTTVNGNLTLDGLLNLTRASGATTLTTTPYRIFDYTGIITNNNTLDFGIVVMGYDYAINTATAQQVNLTTAFTGAAFWDGPNLTSNKTVDGGTGNWTTGLTNWTTANGNGNGAWEDGLTPIFQGTAGTVTLDQPVAVGGMKFNTAGYTLTGSTITLGNTSLNGTTGIANNEINTNHAVGTVTTINSALAGPNGLTKTGTGTLQLGGANTYTGPTTISAGTLQLGASNVLPDTTAVTIAASATFNVNSKTDTIGSLAGSGAVTLGTGALTTGADNTNTTYSGVISDTGSFTKIGTGTQTLSGANTFTGSTNVGLAGGPDAGVLALANTNALSINSSLNIFAGSVNLTLASNYLAFHGDVTLGGGAAGTTAQLTGVTGSSLGLRAASQLIYDATNNPNGALITTGLRLDGGGTTKDFIIGDSTAAVADLTITGAIINGVGIAASGINKLGAGTLELSGANTFNLLTTVNEGTLIAASNTALGTTAAGTTVAAGATLQLANNIAVGDEALTLNGTGFAGNGALRNAAGTNSLSGTVALATNSEIQTDAGTLTLSGVISGPGTLTKTGAGTLTLSGTAANTTTGATSVHDGTLSLNKSSTTAAINSTTVTIGDNVGAAGSAIVSLQAVSQVNDGATVTINSDGLLQLNGNSETITAIAGSGQIDLGGGILAIGAAGANDSTFGGTLAGTTTSRLDKTGTGTLTFTGDMTANPSDFSGTFNVVGGTLAFTADNTFAGDVWLKTGTTLKLSDADLAFDTLLIAGNSTIDFSGSHSTLTVANLTIAAGVTLNIINWDDAADYFFARNWTDAVYDTSNASPMNQIVFNSPTFTASQTHWQSFDDQITPVPEPSTYGAILLGALTGLFAWRRLVRRPAR